MTDEVIPKIGLTYNDYKLDIFSMLSNKQNNCFVDLNLLNGKSSKYNLPLGL